LWKEIYFFEWIFVVIENNSSHAFGSCKTRAGVGFHNIPGIRVPLCTFA